MEVLEQIRKVIEDQGYKQAEFARKINVSPEYISGVLRGRIRPRKLIERMVASGIINNELAGDLLKKLIPNIRLEGGQNVYDILAGTSEKGERWLILPNHRPIYFIERVWNRIEENMKKGVWYVLWGNDNSGLNYVAQNFRKSPNFGEISDKLICVEGPDFLSYCPYLIEHEGRLCSKFIVRGKYVQTKNLGPFSAFPIDELLAMSLYDSLVPTLERLLRRQEVPSFRLVYPIIGLFDMSKTAMKHATD